MHRLAAVVALAGLVSCARERAPSGPPPRPPADSWDVFVSRLPPGTRADVVEAAFSLGESLAMMHSVLQASAHSVRSERALEVFGEAARNDAARLGFTLPSPSMTASFDPRVAEELRRIGARNGPTVARCFGFSYHARQAALLAGRIGRRADAVPGDDFLLLAVQVHTGLALDEARELRLPSDTIREGEALAATLRGLEQRVHPADGAAYEELSRGLWSWHGGVTTTVPFRLRLRLRR